MRNVKPMNSLSYAVRSKLFLNIKRGYTVQQPILYGPKSSDLREKKFMWMHGGELKFASCLRVVMTMLMMVVRVQMTMTRTRLGSMYWPHGRGRGMAHVFIRVLEKLWSSTSLRGMSIDPL